MTMKRKAAEDRRAAIAERLASDPVRMKMEATGLFDQDCQFTGVYPVDAAELRYTMFPNDLFKLMPILSDPAWRALCVIVRRTYGFHRREAVISYSLFMKEGKIGSKSTVNHALDELMLLGIVERVRFGINQWQYALRYKEGGTFVDRQEVKAKKGRAKVNWR